MDENVKLQEGFSQVCVWRDVVLGGDTVENFVAWFMATFNTRIQFLEEIKTNPDVDELGKPIPGTGGRNDIFFAVHNDDIGKFAVPRLSYGISWIEDLYLNGYAYLYPERVANYRTW